MVKTDINGCERKYGREAERWLLAALARHSGAEGVQCEVLILWHPERNSYCSLFEGKRMKIKLLLVDDERDFLEMLSERLEARGFFVRSALNGEEALEVVREGGIDVVILDVRMPGMDGIAILHEIKRIKPLVEVVMLTGQFSVQKAVHGMKAGAFDYIMKPAAIEDLLEKITGAYKRKSEQEERIRNAEIQRVLLTRSWD